MRTIRRILALILFCALYVSTVFGQHSLFDNQNYRRSLELRRMADTAYEQADYLKAEEYSIESERLATLAREEAEQQRLQWIANSWKNRATERIRYGEKYKAEESYRENWEKAKTAYALAVAEYEAKNYESSTEASRNVVALMADFKAPVSSAKTSLPAFYVVRLIPEARDCFWRIAGYPFVYEDPRQWPRLYEANKEKLPEPDNPNLIHPGMVLTIPSINGEQRTGTWSE